MNTRLTQLGSLSVSDFLKDYWQQQAVFLANTLPGFESPLSPDEIAGLALESDIESRLIINSDNAPWQLENGPFDEERFAQLPTDNWSLLVNAVDHWVPEVAALLHKFRFIPNWRLDDIMVSYAPTGGSVGPHFDYYDVFLIQGAGERHWQLGQKCDSSTPLLSGTQLKILSEFDAYAEYTAKPGDVLYIPPGVAHWGRALDDNCITYSVGFRAPSHADILCDFSQELASTLNNDTRFRDRNIGAHQAPGLISDDVIAQLKDIVLQHLDNDALAQWFGSYMTTPKYARDEDGCAELSPQEISDLHDSNPELEPEPGSRFCYRPHQTQADLFIDGQQYQCNQLLASALCDQSRWHWLDLAAHCHSEHEQNLLHSLIASGALIYSDS